jgi:hypothetical protein
MGLSLSGTTQMVLKWGSGNMIGMMGHLIMVIGITIKLKVLVFISGPINE